MNEINDAAIVAALRRQMTIAVARQLAAASNLANVDTPGYRTQDVDFASTLDDRVAAGALRTTDAQHLQPSGSASATTRQVEDLPERRDGNNVQIDRELLQMTHASADFAAAQTALAAKFRLVRYAINEGR